MGRLVEKEPAHFPYLQSLQLLPLKHPLFLCYMHMIAPLLSIDPACQ